jgi:hypothetical protein
MFIDTAVMTSDLTYVCFIQGFWLAYLTTLTVFELYCVYGRGIDEG